MWLAALLGWLHHNAQRKEDELGNLHSELKNHPQLPPKRRSPKQPTWWSGSSGQFFMEGRRLFLDGLGQTCDAPKLRQHASRVRHGAGRPGHHQGWSRRRSVGTFEVARSGGQQGCPVFRHGQRRFRSRVALFTRRPYSSTTRASADTLSPCTRSRDAPGTSSLV